MNEPTNSDPGVKDASIPQEPAAPAAEKTPQQLAQDALFKTTPETPAEPAPPAAPEPAKPADDPDAKLSRLYAQATESEAQMRALKVSHDELQSKLKGFDADKAEWDQDPYAVLEKRGIDPKEWIRRTLELNEDPSSDEVAEHALREVEALKKAAADQQQAAGKQQLQVRAAEIQGHVGKYLKDNGFDALLTSGPAVSQMTEKIFEMEQKGQFKGVAADKINEYVQKLAEHYDGTLRTEVNRYVSAEGAIKALLADEATAKILRAQLGVQPSSEPNGGQVADAANGTGNEPRTITDNLAAQAGSKTNGAAVWNQADARRRAAAAVAKGFTTET